MNKGEQCSHNIVSSSSVEACYIPETQRESHRKLHKLLNASHRNVSGCPFLALRHVPGVIRRRSGHSGKCRSEDREEEEDTSSGVTEYPRLVLILNVAAAALWFLSQRNNDALASSHHLNNWMLNTDKTLREHPVPLIQYSCLVEMKGSGFACTLFIVSVMKWSGTGTLILSVCFRITYSRLAGITLGALKGMWRRASTAVASKSWTQLTPVTLWVGISADHEMSAGPLHFSALKQADAFWWIAVKFYLKS